MRLQKFAGQFILAAFILPVFAGLCAAKTIDFEETGEGQSSKYERPVDAQSRAEENALYKALTKAGVDIFYGYHDVMGSGDKANQFVSSVMSVFSSGISQYARVGEPVCVMNSDGSTGCKLTLKGNVVFNGEPDPKFDIAVDGVKPTYCEGDKVSFSLQTKRDAYPTIIAVDEEKESLLFYPSSPDKQPELKAGEIFIFPKPGFDLVATLAEGKAESQELLEIIMTKNEPLFDAADAKAKIIAGHAVLSMGDFMQTAKQLSKMDREKWSLKLLPYRVIKCDAAAK